MICGLEMVPSQGTPKAEGWGEAGRKGAVAPQEAFAGQAAASLCRCQGEWASPGSQLTLGFTLQSLVSGVPGEQENGLA